MKSFQLYSVAFTTGPSGGTVLLILPPLVKMSLTPTLYTEKPLLTPGAWTSDLIAASTGLPGSNDGPWAKSSTLNHPMWPTIGFQKKKPHQIIMLEKKVSPSVCPETV